MSQGKSVWMLLGRFGGTQARDPHIVVWEFCFVASVSNIEFRKLPSLFLLPLQLHQTVL